MRPSWDCWPRRCTPRSDDFGSRARGFRHCHPVFCSADGMARIPALGGDCRCAKRRDCRSISLGSVGSQRPDPLGYVRSARRRLHQPRVFRQALPMEASRNRNFGLAREYARSSRCKIEQVEQRLLRCRDFRIGSGGYLKAHEQFRRHAMEGDRARRGLQATGPCGRDGIDDRWNLLDQSMVKQRRLHGDISRIRRRNQFGQCQMLIFRSPTTDRG